LLDIVGGLKMTLSVMWLLWSSKYENTGCP